MCQAKSLKVMLTPDTLRRRFQDKAERVRQRSPYGRRPGWALRPVIVKSGDDCRQEALAMQLIQAFDTIFQVSEGPTSEARLCLWRVKCMFSFSLELVSAFDTIFQVCAARLAPRSVCATSACNFRSVCATFACVLRVCMHIYLSTETGSEAQPSGNLSWHHRCLCTHVFACHFRPSLLTECTACGIVTQCSKAAIPSWAVPRQSMHRTLVAYYQLKSFLCLRRQEERLPLWLRPYEVLVTSARTALIEFVPNTASIHAIKAKSPPRTSLRDHYVARFGPVVRILQGFQAPPTQINPWLLVALLPGVLRHIVFCRLTISQEDARCGLLPLARRRVLMAFAGCGAGHAGLGGGAARLRGEHGRLQPPVPPPAGASSCVRSSSHAACVDASTSQESFPLHVYDGGKQPAPLMEFSWQACSPNWKGVPRCHAPADTRPCNEIR